MDFHKVFLPMLAILSLRCKFTVSTEPRCSRFEFEQRLMEKLVRLEVAMEQMKDQTSATGNRLDNCMTEVDRLTLDLSLAQEQLRVPTILFKATKVSNKIPKPRSNYCLQGYAQ
ncbi:uncharacterized protein LOC128240272 [Mya arenaria]|uniref:uncharacterized protein LOC128240272 n=1 Tax=Mya arenaria TaxID=6604 RepID=UPI0022E3E40E|nr:uncharacterized protein LOC128240272 [Mya arenaria]